MNARVGVCLYSCWRIQVKSKLRLRWATLVAVCLALTSLVPMPAQGQNKTVSNLRYRIFDVGTFGGPTSQTNGSRILNNEGVVAGEADTAKPCPFYGGFASLISPAFRWKNGKLTNIGVLPHGCFSLPNGISRNGFIAGSSDNGIIDPNTGVPEIRADFRANGHMFNLGTFGGTNSLANDVNDHGIAVGGAENKDPDPFNFGGNLLGLPSPTAWQAFLWQGHGLKKLGTLGGPDSFALIVNQRDEISGKPDNRATDNCRVFLEERKDEEHRFVWWRFQHDVIPQRQEPGCRFLNIPWRFRGTRVRMGTRYGHEGSRHAGRHVQHRDLGQQQRSRGGWLYDT